MLYFAGGQILKALACEKATRGKVAFFISSYFRRLHSAAYHSRMPPPRA